MRIKELRRVIQRENIDALFVSAPAHIFYLTGLSQFIHPGDAYFLVSKEKSYLFTNSLYVGGVGELKNIELRITHSGNSLLTQVNDIVRHERVEKVGVESGHISLAFYSKLQKELDVHLLSTVGVVEGLRTHKDGGEIRSIARACALTDATYTHALKKIAKGVTEQELAFAIEVFIRKGGGELAFPVIAAFGTHAATPHHANSDKKLEKEDGIILLDFGAKIDGYCSDMTRCVFVDSPGDTVASTYESLLTIQQKTIEFAKLQPTGSPLADIALFCEENFEEEHLPPLPHSLGHGLGIDIHEAPRVHPESEDLLEEGTVFTIEPGVYVPGRLGMRIEDTVGVVENELTQLTNSPKDKVVITV